MKTFLKGFCIGLLCLRPVGACVVFGAPAGLTNGEAQALKMNTQYNPSPEPKAPGRNRLE